MPEVPAAPMTFTCPNCAELLTLSEPVPHRFTCPRCMSLLRTPRGSRSSSGHEPLYDSLDLVEDQVQWDHRVAAWLLIAVLSAVLVGAFCIAYVGPAGFNLKPRQIVGLILTAVIGIVLLALILDRMKRGSKLRSADEIGSAQLMPQLDTSGGRVVLEYATPRPRASLAEGGGGRSWALFFAGIIFGAVGEYLFVVAAGRAGAGRDALFIAIVLPITAGIAMCFRRTLRALGIGLLLSPAVAVLIFVSICFATFRI